MSKVLWHVSQLCWWWNWFEKPPLSQVSEMYGSCQAVLEKRRGPDGTSASRPRLGVPKASTSAVQCCAHWKLNTLNCTVKIYALSPVIGVPSLQCAVKCSRLCLRPHTACRLSGTSGRHTLCLFCSLWESYHRARDPAYGHEDRMGGGGAIKGPAAKLIVGTRVCCCSLSLNFFIILQGH